MLEMDTKGNLYFYRTSLFCKNEIIKRLVNGKYNLVDSAPLGKLFTKWIYIYVTVITKKRSYSKGSMR